MTVPTIAGPAPAEAASPYVAMLCGAAGVAPSQVTAMLMALRQANDRMAAAGGELVINLPADGEHPARSIAIGPDVARRLWNIMADEAARS